MIFGRSLRPQLHPISSDAYAECSPCTVTATDSQGRTVDTPGQPGAGGCNVTGQVTEPLCYGIQLQRRQPTGRDPLPGGATLVIGYDNAALVPDGQPVRGIGCDSAS
jgi:hypothetical protein